MINIVNISVDRTCRDNEYYIKIDIRVRDGIYSSTLTFNNLLNYNFINSDQKSIIIYNMKKDGAYEYADNFDGICFEDKNIAQLYSDQLLSHYTGYILENKS